jgi:hypothetical protein
MRRLALTLAAVIGCLPIAAAMASQPTKAQGPTESIMKSYAENAYAQDVPATLAVFENSPSTYFHINGIFYFTIDRQQEIYQISDGSLYGDGWDDLYSKFETYMAGLDKALSVKTTYRTNGQGMFAPLDGGDKIDGETNYVILAKFSGVGYAIVHGVDQFRIKNNKIANIVNMEKTVFLTPDESIELDALPTDDDQISWAVHRTCELKKSVFRTADMEKRYDIELDCP